MPGRMRLVNCPKFHGLEPRDDPSVFCTSIDAGGYKNLLVVHCSLGALLVPLFL